MPNPPSTLLIIGATLLTAVFIVGQPPCASAQAAAEEERAEDVWAVLDQLPRTTLTPSVEEIKELLTGPQLNYQAEEITAQEDSLHVASQERLSMSIRVMPHTVIISLLLPTKETATAEQKLRACNSSNQWARYWRFYVLEGGEVVAVNTINAEYGLTNVRFIGELIGGARDLYRIVENVPQISELLGQ